MAYYKAGGSRRFNATGSELTTDYTKHARNKAWNNFTSATAEIERNHKNGMGDHSGISPDEQTALLALVNALPTRDPSID